MEKEKLIKMTKEDLKELIKSFFIILILISPFFYFYKNENEAIGLFITGFLFIINYFLGKKIKILSIITTLYFSIFVFLLMFYFKII